MDLKESILITIVLLQLILFVVIPWSYLNKIIPHIKEEYRSKAKLALMFNLGLRKKWVDEEGWRLLNKQGWAVFFYFLSLPIVWILFSLW